MNRDGGAMTSVTQWTETLRQILEEEANVLAKESGFIQRERVLSGADFAQTLIFGWLGEPEITLDGLTQVAGRREVEITASGLCQRFTETAATFLQRLLERLTQVHLHLEAAPTALLKRFSAVIVEDSSQISLPDELAEWWRGSGGSGISAKEATDGITSCDCQWEPRSTPEVGIVLCCRDSCRSRRELAWNWACWLVNGRAYPHA